MRQESFFANSFSCSSSLFGYVQALMRENIVSLVCKALIIFVGAVSILIAVSFFMFGAAQGLSKLLEFDLWVGFLITGVFFILVTFFPFVLISFKAKKKSLKMKAQQREITETLCRKVSEIIDVSRWVQEYPLYSTGAAAVAGFALSGAMTPRALAIAENVLEETLILFIKEHLESKDQI